MRVGNWVERRERAVDQKARRASATSTGLIPQFLFSGLKWTPFASRRRPAVQNPSAESGDGLQKIQSPIERLAPELLFMIFSHLRLSEFFPLRVAGSKYLLLAIREFEAPLPTLQEYMRDAREVYGSAPLLAEETGVISNTLQRRDLIPLDDKRVCLNLAACRGQDALLITILKKYQKMGCRPADDIIHLRTALSFAAENGQIRTAELLLKLEPYPAWYRDQHGHNALDYAAGEGQIEMAKFLLSKGCKVDPDMKQRERELRKSLGMARGWGPLKSETPLIWAIRGEQTAMVEFLLQSGAKNRLLREVYNTHRSQPPLEAALSRGNMDIVNILLAAGAPMDSDTLIAALHTSIEAARVDMVQYICEKGCSMKGNEYFPTPPLIKACWHGNMEIIKILLGHGAQLFQLSSKLSGISALQQAVCGGHLQVVKYLIDKGVDPVIDRSSGHSLLHEATIRDFYDIMKALIATGVRVETTDNLGYSALRAAIGRPSMRALEILLEAGASRVKGNEGETWLWRDALKRELTYASAQAKPDAVRLIKMYGPAP